MVEDAAPPPIEDGAEPAKASARASGPWRVGERLVQEKGWALALGLVLLGLFLRLSEQLGYWINPDEGINYSIISQQTLADCWGELVNNTHPPLLSIVIWVMSLVSADHTWLRMASLSSGCLAIFGTYLAGRELGGKPGSFCGLSGLVAAFLVAVSPFAVAQSRIIRPYMLQLALLSFSIWFLARWLRQTFESVPGTKARGLVGFSVCMSLAIFAQFSSLFILGACGIVLLASVLRRRLPRAAVRPLAISMVAPAATMAFLFVVHISPHLLNSSIRETAQSSWLSAGMGSGFEQLGLNLVGLHVYLFGEYCAGAAVIVSILAIALGLVRGPIPAALALAALAIAITASLTGHYPFGGSRHSGYLLLVLALAIGSAASVLGTLGPIALGIGAVLVGGLVSVSGTISSAMISSSETLHGPQQEVILSGENWKKASRSLRLVMDMDAVIFTNLQSYYCLFPEAQKHWDVDSRRFLMGDADKLIGRSFRMRNSTVLVNEDWEMTIHPSRIKEPAHLYRFVLQTAEQHPELRLRDRRKVWLVFAGWMTQSIEHLKLNAQKLLDERSLQLIHQWEEYPGFIICELDLPVFMTVFGQFDRDK